MKRPAGGHAPQAPKCWRFKSTKEKGVTASFGRLGADGAMLSILIVFAFLFPCFSGHLALYCNVFRIFSHSILIPRLFQLKLQKLHTTTFRYSHSTQQNELPSSLAIRHRRLRRSLLAWTKEASNGAPLATPLRPSHMLATLNRQMYAA